MKELLIYFRNQNIKEKEETTHFISAARKFKNDIVR